MTHYVGVLKVSNCIALNALILTHLYMVWLPIPVLGTEEGSRVPELERHENAPAPTRTPDHPRWYSSADTGSTESSLSGNTHLANTSTSLLENYWVTDITALISWIDLGIVYVFFFFLQNLK